MKLKVLSVINENIVSIKLSGDLDILSIRDFEKEMGILIEKGCNIYILECEDLNYIDSSGIQAFISIAKKIYANKAKLQIKNTKDRVKKVLEMINFYDVLKVLEEKGK